MGRASRTKRQQRSAVEWLGIDDAGLAAHLAVVAHRSRTSSRTLIARMIQEVASEPVVEGRSLQQHFLEKLLSRTIGLLVARERLAEDDRAALMGLLHAGNAAMRRINPAFVGASPQDIGTMRERRMQPHEESV